MLDKLIEIVLKSFSQMGVTLVNVNIDNNIVPEYYVQLDKSKLLQSSDETLKSVYGILWVLTYGKVTDKNRNCKIILNYYEVGESDNADN